MDFYTYLIWNKKVLKKSQKPVKYKLCYQER